MSVLRFMCFFLGLSCVAFSHEPSVDALKELMEGGASYQLVVLVDSKQLQYDTASHFFDSLLAQDTSPTVGHAWILLVRRDDRGKFEWIEGGHSGEFGVIAPRYLDQLLHASQSRCEQDPIQVLFRPLNDGIFERGNGGHMPTCAASFALTKEGYVAIRALLDQESGAYPFNTWSLIELHCVRFVLTCLGRIGIVLDAHCMVQIPQTITVVGQPIRMWSNQRFSCIDVETPEKLEIELQKLVRLGLAQDVLQWYKTRVCM